MDDSKLDPPGGVASIFLDGKSAADRQAEPDLGPAVIDGVGLVTLPRALAIPRRSQLCQLMPLRGLANREGSARQPGTQACQRWWKAEVCVRKWALNI